MAGHLHSEIEKIKKELLSLGAMVEHRLQQAMHSIKTADTTLARQIIETDVEIDQREIEVEEECLKILALYQPVATDLRFLVAVIKINNDLERIADYAANIARRFETSAQAPDKFRYDYTAMADQAGKMLKLSLDALVHWNVDMAYDVRNMDKEVNAMRNDAYDSMKKDIQKHPKMVSEIINMYLISRHLERIGDHSTNIAEEVIYLIEGEIIRHT
ncbi:phosphate uptake regulator, PhoU [Desulfocicer vacuolatum DSM 3385]|uniref:Phosphate-specific transport system accessory protein PhoU n=1 Tax=Desulfocicer vacuolatum DSM 3385 TaxID=1121400 RepID=A0A1W2DJR1_9BACT|nr:phosphate signaling complex protein PhoU [Desulfocicer vacuolatum]SMC97699.1 phosphate uptake regulator, PhoU [Desulfocicer vacuolatum DSM 3385]